jgi:flagellar hook-length control protein FliK
MSSLESLINSIKLQNNQNEKSDYTESKMFSSDTNQFSKILESANKSYNFTYEKVNETPFSFGAKENILKEENFLNNSKFKEITNNSTENSNKNISGPIALNANESKEKVQEYTVKKEEIASASNVDKKNDTAKEKIQEHACKKEENNTAEVKQNDKKPELDKVEKNDKKDDKKVKTSKDDEENPQKTIKNVANHDNLAQPVIIPVHFVQIEKKPPAMEKASSNVMQQQANVTVEQLNNIMSNSNHPEKIMPNKAKQNDDKKTVNLENKDITAKKIDKNIATPLETKQKPDNEVKDQQQSAKKGIAEIQVDAEILKNTKLDTKKINHDDRLKPEMLDSLKAQVTKLQVENIDNKELDLGSNKSGSKSIMFNSIENQVAKLNIDKASNFESALKQTAQRTPVDEANVLEQVYKKTAEQLKLNKSEITIALTPDKLGKVEVNLISEKGILTAQLIAENSQTKDILTKGLESLKQSLQEQGVNVSNVVVKIQEPAPTESNQFNFARDFNQKFGETEHNASHSSGKENQQSNNLYTNSEFENEELTSREASSEQVSHNGSIDYRI